MYRVCRRQEITEEVNSIERMFSASLRKGHGIVPVHASLVRNREIKESKSRHCHRNYAKEIGFGHSGHKIYQ